jgi:hypothetical protein
MYVYLNTHSPRRVHTLYVAPGADDPSTEWKNADGTNKTITVDFIDGRAEVDATLGHYLCAKGYAKRSKIVLPRSQMETLA